MKKFIIAIAAITLMVACKTEKTEYVISGKIDTSLNDNSAYLILENKVIDSTTVVEGQFSFKGSKDTAAMARVSIGDFYAIFVLENGDISVEVNPKDDKVGGTPLNNALQKYIVQRDTLNNTFSAKLKSLSQEDAEYSNTRQEYKNKTIELNSTFFNENKNNTLGAYILLQMKYIISAEEFNKLYYEAGDIVKNRPNLISLVKSNEKVMVTSAGKPFVDFTIEFGNLDSTSVSLSDYVGKGKYVLVDFWASWCGPCLHEMPNLAKIYSDFKGDNFELLSVTVWDKRENSLNAVKQFNIEWPVIFDAGIIPADIYGFTGIPQIMLFAPDGTIIARDLFGADIRAEVVKALS